MSEFLIVAASSSVFPFSHSVAYHGVALIAEPHPNVLKTASSTLPVVGVHAHLQLRRRRTPRAETRCRRRPPCDVADVARRLVADRDALVIGPGEQVEAGEPSVAGTFGGRDRAHARDVTRRESITANLRVVTLAFEIRYAILLIDRLA